MIGVTLPFSSFRRNRRHCSVGLSILSRQRGGTLIRWFADLPVERKLRVVILVPAMTAFAIATLMHVATNLLQLRQEMHQRTADIARTAGSNAIAAPQGGRPQEAVLDTSRIKVKSRDRAGLVDC